MRFSVVLAVVLLIPGCLYHRTARRSSELILFAKIGAQPFHDSIFTIEPDGSNLEQLFTPKNGRSYVHASGNSLREGLVVTIHETTSSGQVENHNFWYKRAGDADQWRRLLMQDGIEGAGYLSPDGSQVICIFDPQSEAALHLHPWIINLASGETKRLTKDETKTTVWDSTISWRPDGREIVFVRLERTADTITSTLMRVLASGGIPVPLFGPDVGVMAACYAPDGTDMAILTLKGLEVVETSNMERRLILPWSSLPNAQFSSGGLVWSRNENMISFAIFNKQTKRYELWTVSADGSHAKNIYSQSEGEGRIGVTAFIQR